MRFKSNEARRDRAGRSWCTGVSKVERVAQLLGDRRLSRASELAPVGRCPKCDGRLFEVALGAAATYARRQCGDCRASYGLVPADASRALEWAANLKIRSERFAGQALSQLARTERGRDLLTWLAVNANAELRRAAAIVLDSLVRP
jgi:hypothetical protein